METQITSKASLQEFKELAIKAHYLTSFSPEKRGEQTIKVYENELNEDLNNIPEEEHERYIENYKKYFSNWQHAQSRCFSVMITGPSGFNNRKHEKANNSERNRYSEFRDWRERAKIAIKRKIEQKKPEEQKRDEAWQRIERDILSTAGTILSINKGEYCGSKPLFVANFYGRIERLAKNGEIELVTKAITLVREINKNKGVIITERHKFFKLEELAQKVSKRREERQNKENCEVPFKGGTLVYNYGIERIQLFFDKIPSEDIREKLKREYRFNWCGSENAWQIKLTSNGKYTAKQFLLNNNLV